MASYYRIGDSLENLKLKVIVREKSSALPRDIVASGELKSKPFIDVKDLSWQQKIIGPREINDELRRGNTTNADFLKSNMLYTYVDRDNFFPYHHIPVASADERESYVGAALHGSINSSLGAAPTAVGDRRSAVVNTRATREKKRKTMHLCLATDVEADNIRNQKPWDINFFFTENLLCSIYIYEDGLLEVTPGLSTITAENASELPASPLIPAASSVGNYSGGVVGTPQVEPTALSLFLDDATVKSGLKSGFKISTFSVSSRNGAEFEYSIQLVNDVLSPMDLEELRKADIAAGNRAAEAARASLRKDDASWKQDPPSRAFDKTITNYAEIVSASGFSANKLFVNYQIVVPQSWALRTGNSADGIAEADALELSRTGVKSDRERFTSALANDGFEDGVDAQGVLSGSTQVASAREWRTGHAHSARRPRRRWTSIPFAFDQLTRIIFGVVFFSVTVISVILGAEYPFWLVPALTIALVVGTGYPSGGPTQLLLVQQNNKQSQRKSGLMASTSEMVGEGVQRGFSSYSGPGSQKICYPLTTEPVAHLNYLMHLSFDAKDNDVENHAIAPSAHVPTILFQVYGVGLLGRHTVEGYGYAHLPDTPGEVNLEIRTWKPLGGVSGKMNEYFLGSAARLRDDAFVEIVNKSATALNRFGVQSGASGTLLFRCRTLVSDPRLKKASSQSTEMPVLPQERRTVEDILYKFKNTMILSRSMNASGTNLLSTSTSKQSLASRLTGADSPARATDSLADILARARSKTAGKVATNSSVPGTPTTASNSPTLNVLSRDLKSSLQSGVGDGSSSSIGTRSRSNSRDRRGGGYEAPSIAAEDDSTEQSPLMGSRQAGSELNAGSSSGPLLDGIGTRRKTPSASSSAAVANIGEPDLPPLRRGLRGLSAAGAASSPSGVGGVSSGPNSAINSARSESSELGAINRPSGSRGGGGALEPIRPRNRYENASNVDTEDDEAPTEQHRLLQQ